MVARLLVLAVSMVIFNASLGFAQQDWHTPSADGKLIEDFEGSKWPRGYFKRDRALMFDQKYYALSQLHEVDGWRVDGGMDMVRTVARKGKDETELTTPTIAARGLYGGEHWTFGLGAGITNAAVEDSNGTGEENYTTYWGLPQVAFTFHQHLTAGVGAELARIFLDESTQATTDEFTFNLSRAVISAAWHTPKMEAGIVYRSECSATDRVEQVESPGSFSLVAAAKAFDDNKRAVYLPAQTTFYARGNWDESWSSLATLGMARYDGNHKGAVELFDKYQHEDRLSFRLQNTYWTTGYSKVDVTAIYRGGAALTGGIQDDGLSYRIANLYGGSVGGTYSFDRQTYVGLFLTYLRGEEDETVDQHRYSVRETQSTIAGTLTTKL